MTTALSLSAPQIHELLTAAVLAPSSHNTQPWHFRAAEGVIDILADRTRALPVNDPEDRELTISCGCALLNLRVALAQSGFGADVELWPDLYDPDLLARVTLADRPPAADDAALYPAIETRRTYRRQFVAQPVPAEVQDLLTEAAAREGAHWTNLGSEDARHAAAALVAIGDESLWANPSWRRELAAWMHPRRRGDGLTVPGLVAPVTQQVIRTFDMGHGVAAKDRELAEASPLLGVLTTPGDEPLDWLHAGQALERLLLTGVGLGLQASHLNQPIQVPHLRSRLQRELDLPGVPQVLLRMGFPAEVMPASPRREPGEVWEGRGEEDDAS